MPGATDPDASWDDRPKPPRGPEQSRHLAQSRRLADQLDYLIGSKRSTGGNEGLERRMRIDAPGDFRIDTEADRGDARHVPPIPLPPASSASAGIGADDHVVVG
jgi:hypothetical protein